ncbi:MAG: 3-dehydroquinate synthase [Bacteroidales bacterium]|nr:3-dehydroquinate synthase [Bacteroidales bacterium]MDD4362483.1 3-dehydroquinate synthase [Bacteroidales bacterium]MDD4431105.1 3-dehydroquinate synthase [Bacteroidales bacterium]
MTKILTIHQQTELENSLNELLSAYEVRQVFVLCDDNSKIHCLPLIAGFPCLKEAQHIIVPAGDEHKNLETLSTVWSFLSRKGGTRKSLLINLGGGMPCDLGGFAAACFKRGIDFINIPTTLLACVDAALGGKTGINFNGLKNEIGAFYPAKAVLIYPAFFRSLDRNNLYSGYAEMLKHGLLSSHSHWQQVLHFDPTAASTHESAGLILDSMSVKERIVGEDPFEKGLRKALNLGHTIGHAFESLSHKQHKPLLHGHAVALGLVCELYLSHKLAGFPLQELKACVDRVKQAYSAYPLQKSDYPALIGLMQHDKKNRDQHIRFCLLKNIGDILPDETATREQIEASLDYYCESML